MEQPFARVPSAPVAHSRASSTTLALVLGLTFAVTGLMAVVAAWMYWIVPSLLR